MKSVCRYQSWLTTRYFSYKMGKLKIFLYFWLWIVFCMTQVQQQKSHLLLLYHTLPYLTITECDTAHTVMCNFQEIFFRSPSHMFNFCARRYVLFAKRTPAFSLARFDNVFLVLGSFHTEKVIIIACCGEYLEDNGIDSILVENKVYGPENLKHVMNVSYYVRWCLECWFLMSSWLK